MQTHPPASLAAFAVACSRLAPRSAVLPAPSDDALPTCATLRRSFRRRTPSHGVSAQTVPLFPSWSASYASVAPSMKPSQCRPSGPNLTAVAGPNQNARIILLDSCKQGSGQEEGPAGHILADLVPVVGVFTLGLEQNEELLQALVELPY